MNMMNFRLLITVSFLTAWTGLLIYLNLPAHWLCETGENPLEKHLPRNRCPRRLTALLIMTVVTAFLLLTVCGADLYDLIEPDSLLFSEPDSPFFSESESAGRRILAEPAVPAKVLFLLTAELLLLPAALCDMDYCVIPDQSCAGALFLALIGGFFFRGAGGLAAALAGALFCGLMMLLSSGLSVLFSGKEGMGMGDVKLAAAGGALAASAADPGMWFFESGSVFVSSVLLSAVWFSILLLFHRAQYGDARPMGPWIILSVLTITARG